MLNVDKKQKQPRRPVNVDPITSELVMQGLCALPNLIDKNITRTAFSFLVAEYKDYAVGIVDADGRLISQSRGGLPIFCANALSAAVVDGLRVYGKSRLQEGDVVISNHAATMGQHLNNVVMYTPFRLRADDDGLLGFFAIVMHWVDIGGITPGSCSSPTTTDIFQEGIQFRTVKLLQGGKRSEELYRIIEENTRFPKMVMGDLESQVAGCLMGRDMTMEVVNRFGAETVLAAIAQHWDRAERAVRAAIRNIPDGVYTASSYLDDDGINRGKPLQINVKVIVSDDEITIDFSDIADQVNGPLNSGFEGGAVAAARIACKYIFSPNEPANDGAFRAIKVQCPPGKLLSARPGAPLGSSGSTIPTVVDTILRAISAALPNRIPAAHHGSYNLHGIDGRDPETGDWFRHTESSVGGWGAAFDRDGTGPFRSMAHGDTKEIPVELQEATYPYHVEWVRLRRDSGGAGEFRGGLGIEKSYHILERCRLTARMERTKCPPWGTAGGTDGQPGRVEVYRDGKLLVTVAKGEISLEPDDRVRVITAGGGGYGDPGRRAREKIERDIDFGYISRETAEKDYSFQR
jgi:N-methylhydantoinase B